jgi:hypothetical protein
MSKPRSILHTHTHTQKKKKKKKEIDEMPHEKEMEKHMRHRAWLGDYFRDYIGQIVGIVGWSGPRGGRGGARCIIRV